jgi:hypothetical protein
MNESGRDGDRIVFVAALLLCLISAAMYLVLDLTRLSYGTLNTSGRTVAIVALAISGIAMLLACYLALTNRSASLATTGLSGFGWVFICASLVVGAPALGLEFSLPGSSFGGVPAALLMVIAGAAVLQAERNLQQTGH